jgi:hypothetical protein
LGDKVNVHYHMIRGQVEAEREEKLWENEEILKVLTGMDRWRKEKDSEWLESNWCGAHSFDRCIAMDTRSRRFRWSF